MVTSDAPCRARRGSSPWGETSSRTRTAFPAAPSRATASAVQSAFHRFDAPRCVSAPRLAGARHQLRGFATNGAASSCRFALVARATRTRPGPRHRFITGGRRRAGRLESTSADENDPRARPRSSKPCSTSLPVSRVRSHAREDGLSTVPLSSRWQRDRFRDRQPTERSRVRGLGVSTMALILAPLLR